MTDVAVEYAAEAHTSARTQQRPPRECRHSRKFKLFAASGERLPHRHPSVDMSPMHGWQNNTPKQLRALEADPEMAKYEDPKYRHDLLDRWDEECLRHMRPGEPAGALEAMGAVVFFLVLFVTTILSIILLIAFKGLPPKDELITLGLTYGFMYAVPLGMWGGGALLRKLDPNFAARVRPCFSWELNRRTGEVIVYTESRETRLAPQVRYRLPFHEFDCYLQSTPSPQGSPQYYLSLVHYAEEAHVSLAGMFGSTTSHVEQRAAWDMLQRYMDISQPLPDIPGFESDRPRDPTTREHDERTGRDPRFWRDMDDETYATYVSAHQDKLNAFYRR